MLVICRRIQLIGSGLPRSINYTEKNLGFSSHSTAKVDKIISKYKK